MIAALIDLLGRPIVSTSANVQGEFSPTHYNEIEKKIIDQVDYVFKTDRHKNNGSASLLIKFNEEGELLFLR